MIRYYIGGDESYDVGNDGNFILNFFVLDNEEEFLYLNNEVKKLVDKLEYKELKSRHINHESKLKLFACIKKTNYKNFTFQKKTIPNWSVEDYYLEGVTLFLSAIGEYLAEVTKSNTKIVFILDNIEGPNFQSKCIKKIRVNFKNSKVKCIPEFVISSRAEIVQIADVIAGEYRKFVRGISKFKEFPLKNKSLNVN